jgi:adenylate kinase family enzyme
MVFLKKERKKIKNFIDTEKNPQNIFKENFSKNWVENPRTVSGWLYKRFPRKTCQSRSTSLSDQQLTNFPRLL